jgi:TP901 family phage tail tape measure protein
MAKIREELEIVSSDDLNSLLNRLNKLKDEIKDTNNTTVKPKTDSSEIDKANIKLDNLRKNAQSGIDAKVNVQLDASDLKRLNNLPTAKAKVDFLVNKGTISKSIGKDLQAAIGKAYSDVSRKFKDFPGLDKEPNISLDNFMKRVPELSARQRSGIIQTLTDKGIISDKNIPESYETVYRLKSYLENAKKAVSKTIPSEAFTAPDLSLSATEYGNAINEQVKLVQNVLNASKFFADLSSKMNVKAAAKVSPEEMYKLMGVGSEKADTGNYVAYLADQIAKKANVYDIIDQVVTGALDPTQISQKDIANSISKITKKKESTPKASFTGKTKKKVKPVIDDSDDSDRPEGNIEKLYDELKDAYKNFVEARKARKTNSIHPSDYALKSAVFREAYAKVAPHLFDDEKEKFVGPKPMSQEVAQLAADSTRKTVEQIYSIKKPLKDLGYLGNNPDVSKIFDRISNRIIKINADKLNNRDNENGDTDEIIKNIGVMNKLASQLEDMIHADGHVDFAIKNLPTITKPATTASSLLDNSDIKKQTEETADAITRTADQVIDAKSKEADAVVAANDKIAESEKKVTNRVTDAAKEQNDTIKTVFGLKNVNSNLTEEPVTPPELDGLKQLSQREFGDAQKYIKVYEDTNRTIYTLTQTYKKQFDANGNLLAEGYENAIAYYDSYEKLEGEAIKLSKKINSNYAKLDTEKYKSTDKQNPNYLKKLQDDIKSDQQDLSELHRIARLNASLPDNDYMYQNFTQALRKGSAESARSLSATRKTNRDNFNVKKDTLNTDISKQISDIESLGQAGAIAAEKLQGIQKSLSTITTPAGLENVQKQITDINEQFDSNKARESALNYVHNLEQGLTGKQNVVIGTKNASDNFTGSIENGKWIGPLAGLNRDFESTSAKLDGYIADAEKLGDVGEKAADSFSTLKENLKTCYTESGLKQIQGDMKVTQAQLTASKKQADAIKNSDIAKQYDNAIDKAKEVKSLNAELLGYKKKQSQYSKGSDTYTEIGNRITETAETAKKANDAFEKLTQNDFVSKNSEALKNAGKNVEDYDKVVREMKQAQADVSGFDEKVIQANNKEVFTKQYTQAIEKVKELKSAMQDLYSFEAKGAKGQISSDDFISGFTDRFKNIKNLKKDVDEFKKNTYQNNKDDADSVLDQLLFGNYEKAFTDSEQSMSDYENKITTLMTQAYSRQRKLSNDLYKMAGNKNYSEQEYTEKMNQRNGVQATYEALKAQIKNSGKNIDSDSLISDIKNASDLDRNNILGNLKESLSSQINDFENSLKHMQNTMNLPDGIASLKEKLESAFTFENGADNIGNFKNRMQDFYQTFDSLKGSSFIQFANEFGTAFDSLTKAENSSGKVSAYTDKLNGFVESYNDIVTRFHNKEIDTSQAQDEISELASKMQDFQKVAKNYDKTNSKGTYLEGTKGLVQDTKDVETMLTEYANSIGLTSKISSSINETTGQVKMQFADISGNVVTLTGNLEKAGNAMRIISSTASKASTGMSSFGTSIKGMVSGNFKGAIADIASYVSYFQVTMKAIQQAKQGFNDFLNFQKDLTNISYTMNLSPDQLQNLGTSAIDMAKDLSMSLDNTMDIYKIYANMNTTASEIQQTAKPTAILSNLSGVDASTAADQVQGILQQFHMLEDGSTTAADASMHIVDVLDKVSGSVGIDYAKGIKIISDAVQASGQVAYDAGMSYEQLAAITAKVSERTREDGSSIGNALKTIITRTTKVGKMPQYADEVDNATLSNASASLHAIGVDVYNPDGSDRGIITVMSELKDKWDDLTDAQQAKISYDVAATRQTSKFKSMLDAFTDSMSLAEEATTANGNAEANQEKYMESTAGKLQAIKTQMQDFWVNFYNSGTVNGVLEFVHSLTEGFTSLEKTLGPIPALLTAVFAAMTVKNATMAGLKFLSGGGLATVVG